MRIKFEKFLGLLLVFAATLFILKFFILSKNHKLSSQKPPAPEALIKNSIHWIQNKIIPEDPFIAHLKSEISQQPDLKMKMQDLKEITLKSNLKDSKLNSKISARIGEKIGQAFHTTANGKFIAEAELFDTASNLRFKKRPNSKANTAKLIVQFSVFDAKTMNKVGEFSVTEDVQ